MRPKAWIAKLEDVSEDLRSSYEAVQDGDGFVFALEGANGYRVEPVDGLKNTVLQVKRERDEAKQRLKAFGDLDPEAARSAVAKIEEIGDKADPEKFEAAVSSRVAQVEKKLKGDLAEMTKERDAISDRYSAELRDSTVMSAIAKHKGRPELLSPAVRMRTTVKVGDDGSRTVVVVDPATGNPLPSTKAGSTDLMTVDELVGSLKEDATWGVAFTTDVPSGGGAGSGDAGKGGGGASPGDLKNKTPGAMIADGLAEA
jgi:hypothetical protein